MSTNVWNNRPFPRVGIRPVIDGRCNGVRESLEDQVMGMAERAAAMISKSLKYPDGSAVECVIADTNIGGCVEAQACADKFARENVGLSLTVTPCWCYGSETMDLNPLIPKAVWGFNGTERPGAVYLAAVLAGHAQKGLPAFGIYGREVQDRDDTTIPADVQEKILRFVKGGLAVAMLRNQSYLSIGTSCMGIAGSFVDCDFFQSYLGMRNENVDMCEVDRRIDLNIFDQQEFEKALSWTKKHCKEAPDTNDPSNCKNRAEKDSDWEFVVKMAIIIRDLMVGNPKLAEMGYPEEALGRGALAAGFQGQRQWTDYKPNGDFAEAILNSSFDWNGIRAPYIVATENDSLNGVCMLLMYLLTNRAQIFADVRTFWSPEAVERVTGTKMTGLNANGFIHLINSGAATLDACGKQREAGKPAMKPWWEISSQEADNCLAATLWCPANLGYFRGGGFSSSLLSEGGMPLTMTRISMVKGLGPVLQIAEGWSTELPEDVHKTLMARTDATWPCTWFVPRLTGKGAFTDVYSVMNNWSANHGAISYGHIGADITTLASMLRIPIAMSNVDESDLYRPHAWGLFGTSCAESADYRACSAYGALYK
ncbi:MAG: L-fucose isomerase [Kiritimatiellae bacterium]|nr:L-fucose isomerase [Kiritimatiellia bacterium]